MQNKLQTKIEKDKLKEPSTNPLVSVIVITYNSSKYVLETLESTKSQTYHNIELIISDDCSTDNTFEICSNWINENKSRFVRSELITTEKNSGVAYNCNRGLFVAKGQWLKFIAGDDILLNNCILRNLLNVNHKNNCTLIFSKSIVFDTFSQDKIYIKPDAKFILPVGFRNQLKQILKKDFVNTPTCFILRETILKLGGFDTRFPFMEDYPMWLKFLQDSNEIFYFPEITVKYRITNSSLSNCKNSISGINNLWIQSRYNFYKTIIIPELKNNNMYLSSFLNNLDFFIIKRRMISQTVLSIFIYRAFGRLIYVINRINRWYI